MKIICLSFLILFILLPCKGQTWGLIWSDEFDSTSINTNNWTYDIGTGGWGNSELECYTNRQDNAKVSNGNLLIIAKQESYNGSNYTSARIKTQGLTSITYGKIEARIKLPVGQGMWPAFWMLGSNITQVGWPECGEIDIMENINGTPTIYGTMHWENNGNAQYGGSISCDVTQYHVYSIEWNSNSINWSLDGNQYWTGNIASNINSTEAFHLPFFIALNLAVGGNWPGNPNSSTQFPDTMSVDYVRVYQQGNNSVGETNYKLPDHYELLQNYPNPFNPTTTFSFNLPSRSSVSLKVFDMLGREVTTIVSEELSAGNYTRQWNAIKMSSGIYFYRLQAGSFIETKDFVLLK